MMTKASPSAPPVWVTAPCRRIIWSWWLLTTSRRGRDWLPTITSPGVAEGPDLFKALRAG